MNIDTNFLSRLEFIEFKQQVLLLKQPNHKVNVFANLSLDQFLDIKEYVKNFQSKMSEGKASYLKDFELGLYKVCPLIKTYPGSSILIAKILMNLENYDLLFSSNN